MSMTSAGCKYASAGAVFADDVRFHVKDRAYLPDSDAGTDLAGCYRADHKARRARSLDLPVRLAVILAAAVFFICAISVLTRVYQVRGLEDQIAGMRSQMAVTREANEQLTFEELGRLHEPPISKSGVKHRLEKILRAAEELKKETEGTEDDKS